jgi:hypothetical protein
VATTTVFVAKHGAQAGMGTVYVLYSTRAEVVLVPPRALYAGFCVLPSCALAEASILQFLQCKFDMRLPLVEMSNLSPAAAFPYISHLSSPRHVAGSHPARVQICRRRSSGLRTVCIIRGEGTVSEYS